jgi:hypothetical protein
MIISLRRTSASTRALLVAAVLLVLILRWWTSPKVSFDEEQLESLWTMPRDDVARLYESKRQSLLEDQGYNPQAAAQSVRCPPWTADGYPSLDSRPDVYANRLGTFVLNRLGLAPMRSRLDHAIGRVYKQVPPTISAFPQHLYSTDRFGDAGVPDAFRLWKALLPLPLDGSLENLVPQTEWAMPARKGSPWSVLVADSSDIETHLSAWVGDSISKGAGGWAQFWQALSGRHRAQVFKFVAQ